MAETTVVTKKEDQHLVVPANFGRIPAPPDPKTGKSSGSLKHGGNLGKYDGWMADVDTGGIARSEIKARLDVFGISFSGWPTWRDAPGAPRSRLTGEFSSPKSHAEYVHELYKINSALGGLVAPESGAIAQGMLVGRRKGAVFDRVTGDGDVPLDLIDERDIGVLPFVKTKPGGTKTGGAKNAKPDYSALSEDEVKELIGEHYFGPLSELARRYCYQGIPEPDTVANLTAFVDQVDAGKRDRKWSKARASIPRWVADAYAFLAKQRGTHLRALVTYLSDDPLWRGVIRLNEFTQVIELMTRIPPVLGVRRPADPRPLREVDILETLLFLQGNGFPKATITDVWRAVTLTAEHHAFHPVRKYFDQREWNKRPRLHRLFSTADYFPPDVPNDPEARADILKYLERIGPCFMVGAVARISKPGVKVDTVPVLVSPEAFDKSKGLRELAPDPAWFTDDISSNLIDRDTKESLTGKLIIELAEIPHIRRENEKVKAFFSRQVDRFRQAYARATEDRPRQCVFIGTSNNLELLSESGNRRFWPVPLAAPVNVAKIVEDRDQLWAEAVHLYRSGFEWWLPPKLELLAGLVQAAFVEADPWDELILGFLDCDYPQDADGRREPFTLKEVIEGIGFRYRPGEREMPTRADELRVARRLRVLRFHPDPHRHRSDDRQRFWVEIPKRST